MIGTETVRDAAADRGLMMMVLETAINGHADAI